MRCLPQLLRAARVYPRNIYHKAMYVRAARTASVPGAVQFSIYSRSLSLSVGSNTDPDDRDRDGAHAVPGVDRGRSLLEPNDPFGDLGGTRPSSSYRMVAIRCMRS